MDNGIIDVGVGDFNPGDGVGVSGEQGGEVNGFGGGGGRVVGGRGDDGGGEILVGGVLTPGIYQITGADGEAGDQGDTGEDNQEAFGSGAMAGTRFWVDFGRVARLEISFGVGCCTGFGVGLGVDFELWLWLGLDLDVWAEAYRNRFGYGIGAGDRDGDLNANTHRFILAY